MNNKKAKNAEGPLESLVSIPIELNPENSQLELTNVATHHITNDQASNYMPEVHSQLERYGVKLPSLERYRSPPDFRLLFSIIRNNELVDTVISDPIRDGKPWKIVECVGKRTPILMTEQKELCVFLSDFPQNSNNKVTASFSYKDEGDNDVVFPGKGNDKEIPLRRINQGGGTFITPLFPTPNPSREVKATLILKKYSAGFVEMDSMEGFTFKPKNGPTLSGKREHARPIDGEHSTRSFQLERKKGPATYFWK